MTTLSFEPTRSVLMASAPLVESSSLMAAAEPFAAFPSCETVQILPDCVNIAFYRGDSLSLVINVWSDTAHTVPADLSNATAQAQIRTTADAVTIEASFSVTIVSNQVRLSLTPGQTADLPDACVWDCQVDWEGDGSEIRTVAGGDMTVVHDVTRP